MHVSYVNKHIRRQSNARRRPTATTTATTHYIMATPQHTTASNAFDGRAIYINISTRVSFVEDDEFGERLLRSAQSASTASPPPYTFVRYCRSVRCVRTQLATHRTAHRADTICRFAASLGLFEQQSYNQRHVTADSPKRVVCCCVLFVMLY